MDFANRVNRPGQDTMSGGSASNNHKGNKIANSKLVQYMSIVLLFSATIVALSLIVFFIFGGRGSESEYVKKKQYQAVFLNGGQVYFGKIGKFNDKYITLSDIYYLRVNQAVQPDTTNKTTNANDISLAKLGSELHGPEDQMMINRSEVQFWENLKDDGQVVKAITAYKQNPTAANQQTNTTNTNTTNTTTNTTNTNTTTPTTKKP